MPVATFPLGPLQTNSYLIHNAGQAVAVDVGGEPAPMLEYLAEHKLVLAVICLTHRHFDHLYGVAELAGVTKAVVYAPTGDDSLAETESGKGGGELLAGAAVQVAFNFGNAVGSMVGGGMLNLSGRNYHFTALGGVPLAVIAVALLTIYSMRHETHTDALERMREITV